MDPEKEYRKPQFVGYFFGAIQSTSSVMFAVHCYIMLHRCVATLFKTVPSFTDSWKVQSPLSEAGEDL